LHGLDPISPEDTERVLSNFTRAHEGLTGRLAAAGSAQTKFGTGLHEGELTCGSIGTDERL